MFFSKLISSPLGDIVAVANDTHLIILEFADSLLLGERYEKLGEPIGAGVNPLLTQTQIELAEYFEGKRKVFTVPYRFIIGTDFQKQAWDALTKIPYGETRSYKEEAIIAGSPKAVRAIGGANNKNPIVIIVPCHRVIGADGKLVGYGGGMDRKKWLLENEQHYYS